MKRSSNCDLPAEIILEILLRLPVKTLLRFKCVCKHWYTLIESRSFINRHFGHDNNQGKLLIRLESRYSLGYRFALYVDEMFSRYEEPDHLQFLEKAAALLGPLNGVFCVSNCVVDALREMALLNPAVRQFKPLPLIRWNVQPHLVFMFSLIGFGLDLPSGDYKLVWVQYFWNKEMNVPNYPHFVYVYNSGSDTWRHFENVDSFNSMNLACRSLCDTYLNGVYYWVIKLNDGGVAILAFDMSSEKFQEIQVPDCIIFEKKILDIFPYNDSIALLLDDHFAKIGRCVSVWVMGKERCWTKCLTIGPFQGLLNPRGFWKSNELLLEGLTSEGLASVLALNVSNQKLTTVKTLGRHRNILRSGIFSYKESLVSLKREGDNCKLWDTSSDFVKNFFMKYF